MKWALSVNKFEKQPFSETHSALFFSKSTEQISQHPMMSLLVFKLQFISTKKINNN